MLLEGRILLKQTEKILIDRGGGGLLLRWKYFFLSFTEVLIEYIDSHYLLLTDYCFSEVKMSKVL